MRYRTAGAFRDALEQRLRDESRENGVGLLRLRKRVAFERFLARLVATGPDGWVLKGAFALEVRLGLRARATKDVDLGRSGVEQAATQALVAATAMDLGDCFVFRVRRTAALDEARGFHAVRYRVESDLDGRRFERFPVDVAIGELPELEPDTLPAPGALAFAEVESFELPVVALEQHIAEKLHAYTRGYGTDDQESTRSKDLVDLVLIATLAAPEAARLHTALKTTFQQRGRQALPDHLPPAPAGWASPYAQQAQDLALPADLTQAHAAAAALLVPVLMGNAAGRWDSQHQRWGGSDCGC